MRAESKYASGCLSLAASVAAVLSLPAGSQAPWWALLFAAGCSLFFARLAKELRWHRRKRAIAQRSAEATALVSSLTSGRPAEAFTLYLRPFYADEITMYNANPVRILPLYLVDDRIKWESLFVRKLERFTRIIALRGFSVGPGADRVETSDYLWRDRVMLLSLFAKAIILFPSVRGGALWELRWLRRNGLIDKCIFVVPTLFDEIVARHGESWQSIRAELTSLKIDVPSNIFDGVAFSVNEDGTIREQRLANSLGSRELSGSVAKLLRPLLKRPSEDPAATRKKVELARDAGRNEPPCGKIDPGHDDPAPSSVASPSTAAPVAGADHDWVEQQLE